MFVFKEIKIRYIHNNIKLKFVTYIMKKGYRSCYSKKRSVVKLLKIDLFVKHELLNC